MVLNTNKLQGKVRKIENSNIHGVSKDKTLNNSVTFNSDNHKTWVNYQASIIRKVIIKHKVEYHTKKESRGGQITDIMNVIDQLTPEKIVSLHTAFNFRFTCIS